MRGQIGRDDLEGEPAVVAVDMDPPDEIQRGRRDDRDDDRLGNAPDGLQGTHR
jgi:hypothetical protein